MTNFTTIYPVEDSDKISEYHQVISRLFGTIYSDRDLWLRKEEGWTATISYDYFVEEDFEKRLVKALASHAYSEVIAIAWEELLNFPRAFIIPSTLEAIEEFNLKNPGFLFVIFAGKPDWLIFLTRLDYLIIAGQPKFVREVLGCEPDQSFKLIHEISESENIDPVVRKHYMRILDQLQVAYPQAAPGTVIDLGWLDWSGEQE